MFDQHINDVERDVWKMRLRGFPRQKPRLTSRLTSPQPSGTVSTVSPSRPDSLVPVLTSFLYPPLPRHTSSPFSHRYYITWQDEMNHSNHPFCSRSVSVSCTLCGELNPRVHLNARGELPGGDNGSRRRKISVIEKAADDWPSPGEDRGLCRWSRVCFGVRDRGRRIDPPLLLC